MPVLLDYLVSQVVSVPDHILDTFKFSKYLGLALDPASTLYPQNIRNIRHTVQLRCFFKDPPKPVGKDF